MAGARFVEEVLDRGGAERFAITVFGAEPGGGYSRIALPNVLSGSQDARDMVLNPPEWYVANGVACVPAARSRHRPRARGVTDALGAIHPYDDLVIATGSRAAAFPPVRGCAARTARCARRLRLPLARGLRGDGGLGPDARRVVVSAAACSGWRPGARWSSAGSTSRSCSAATG